DDRFSDRSSLAFDVRVPESGEDGCALVLWARFWRPRTNSRGLCRQDLERSQARRPADPSTKPAVPTDQQQDRWQAWDLAPRRNSASRRRGDRMNGVLLQCMSPLLASRTWGDVRLESEKRCTADMETRLTSRPKHRRN